MNVEGNAVAVHGVAQIGVNITIVVFVAVFKYIQRRSTVGQITPQGNLVRIVRLLKQLIQFQVQIRNESSTTTTTRHQNSCCQHKIQDTNFDDSPSFFLLYAIPCQTSRKRDFELIGEWSPRCRCTDRKESTPVILPSFLLPASATATRAKQANPIFMMLQ